MLSTNSISRCICEKKYEMSYEIDVRGYLLIDRCFFRMIAGEKIQKFAAQHTIQTNNKRKEEHTHTHKLM